MVSYGRCTRALSVLLLALYLSATVVSAAEVATHSRSHSFPPIRASQASLYKLIDRIRVFVASANDRSERRYEVETITLKGGSTEITLRLGFTETELGNSPQPSTEVRYHYQRSDSPVSQVHIILHDSLRTITITGTSREQVDALMGLVGDELLALETTFGGYKQRFWAGLVLHLLGTFLVMIGIGWVVSVKNPTDRVVPGMVLALGILTLYFVWSGSWDEWFPGMTILSDDSTVLERNGVLIGIVSTLVSTAIGVAVTFALRGKSKSPQSPSDSPS